MSSRFQAQAVIPAPKASPRQRLLYGILAALASVIVACHSPKRLEAAISTTGSEGSVTPGSMASLRTTQPRSPRAVRPGVGVVYVEVQGVAGDFAGGAVAG
jgi:hypothetical protein